MQGSGLNCKDLNVQAATAIPAVDLREAIQMPAGPGTLVRVPGLWQSPALHALQYTEWTLKNFQ